MKKKAKIGLLDLLLACVILIALGYVAYRINTHLHYKWDWKSVPQYLLRFDEESGGWLPNVLLLGLYNTIRLSLWGTVLATLIGTVMGLCRVSHHLFSRWIGRTYVESIRNVPPLVLIFIFYYFLSGQVMSVLGIDSFLDSRSQGLQDVAALLLAPPSMFSAFVSALITLAIFEGAYITEIVRAGIESIEKGTWEAAYALGLSRWQQMRYVILPLAAQRILPPLAGQFISTIKDSAIVSVISIPELTFQGMELMSATYLIFEIWIVITALYFILTLSLSLAIERWEIYLRRSEA
ncbi:MAG: amino acid ABC transporter permease [Deltaproteobacteria bacterium RBG_13_53_10]|nr:MAG: amino acid ABC transporter permease [Deltaproteobacteria bacterium RBG_13_53_10]